MTAQQIAAKLGISNATVSRVLNNSQHVSPQAREAVMAAIRQTGSVPRVLGPRNRRASSATSSQPGLVRILHVMRFPLTRIPESPNDNPYETGQIPQSDFYSPQARISTSYERHIVEGIIDELRKFNMRGVQQVVTDLHSRDLLAEVNHRENTGVFLRGIYDDDVPEFLEKCRCPVVTFMTWDHNGWPDYVGIDNYRGIRLAFQHLIALGHKRIGFVAGQLMYSAVFHERLAAYKSLLADSDLPYRRDWVIEGSCHVGPISDDAEKILRSPDRPSAFLCCYDGAAIGVKRAADKLGLRVPSDLSVVGFDDQEIAQLFSPPLTTVHVPTMQMGRQAVQVMMMRQQHPIRPGEGISLRVTPTLVQRQSTAAPPPHH